MANTKNVRELVLDILVENEVHHTYSNVLIRKTQDQNNDLTLSERSFLKRLAEGTIERRMELDTVINKHLQHPENKLKPAVRCLLRMSVYQIYYMDSVTDYAAVDEAIKILRRRHLNDVTGFVNGVLRSICRDKAAADKGVAIVMQGEDGERKTIYKRRKAPQGVIRTVTTGQNKTPGTHQPATDAAAMGRTYSMPQEIVSLWEEDLGEEETKALLAAMLEIRPVTIRMDVRQEEGRRQEILEAMQAAGIKVTQGRWLAEAYQLSHMPRMQEIPGFTDGVFTVQDESSQLAAYAAGLAKADQAAAPVILDLCAAPGGKSMAAASLAPQAQIHSYDVSQSKTDQIRANIERMHYDNIEVAEQDATVYNESLEGIADIVICDVPCSGLGVITKKRDIKYNITGGQIRSLVNLQRQILRNAVRYVKKGGVLVYSTCTIDKKENERQAAFLQKELGLTPDDLAPFLPENLPGIKGNMVQLLPHVHGTDGFFIARFVKR